MSQECGHRGTCRQTQGCFVVMWQTVLDCWLTAAASTQNEVDYRLCIRHALDAYGCEYRPREGP